METSSWGCLNIPDDFDELEMRIDEAIEKGDVEALSKLLNERERMLTSLPQETLRIVQKRDEERLKKLEELRGKFLREFLQISVVKESLLKNTHDEGRTIGRG